jgi:NADP-dependent 3-hydroxy acid dehydrogenase YdfG
MADLCSKVLVVAGDRGGIGSIVVRAFLSCGGKVISISRYEPLPEE